MNERRAFFLLTSSVGLAAVFGSAAGGNAPEDPDPPLLRNGMVPIGSLGYPLGDYLKIEGVRIEGFKMGISSLLVDTINGKKLPKALSIWVDNVDLPPKMRCVLKGYETVEMIGSPPAWGEAARELGKEANEPQFRWGTYLKFVALSIVSPDDLKIRKVREPRP